MANEIISPSLGLFSDEEETPPVFESTAAEFGAEIRKDLLTDFSAISPGLGYPQSVPEEVNEKVLVYLRVRPFMEGELEKKEDQGCVLVEDQETLVLRAPKESFAMKSIERGLGQSVHKFTFSQIFKPEVEQKQFFEGTMKRVVKDVLNGQNWLVYTYGVTNSGKTYTIQGSNKDGGILPRSISLIFNSAQDHLYKSSDLKPLSNEVIWLDSKQVRQEEMKKISLLSNLREEELLTPLKKSGSNDSQSRAGISASFDSGVAGLSSSSQFVNQTSSRLEESSFRWGDPDAIPLPDAADLQLSIWVSYFEIYNEFLYDLLEPISSGPNRKRTTLRLCEDRNGNPYVKDLNWINVHNADEAWKVLKVGRKNQSFASTHLNQNSSRSHSIFSIRILHLQGGNDVTPKISELSFCDLAGSERCKDQRSGDRFKEATNINTSLHTLGRCITTLRQNQQQKLRQNMVPFRDSKLTRVFQGFFIGRGRSCMIVNINQCASTYDETLHAMKFSAIASQLVQAPPAKLNVPSIQSFIKESNLRANRSCTEDEESEDESDNEADVTMFNREELLHAIESMKELLVQERQEKLSFEMRIREEVCNEMMQQMQQQTSQCSEHFEDERDLLEDMHESRLENLKESLTNYYQKELEERDEKIEELEAALQEASSVREAPSMATQCKDDGLPVRRSQRLAVGQSEMKQELMNLKVELQSKNEEIQRYQRMQEAPASARSYTADVDRKLLDGQKRYAIGSLHTCTDFQHTRALWNVRMLRSELQKFTDSLHQVERVCCHTTGAEKLRHALSTCDDILTKQDQALAELQNNMVLVKMDLKKKAVCIAEQYHTVQKLQGAPSGFKRNNENVHPNHVPEKRPFLRNFLARTPGPKGLTENSPYNRILRARQTPVLKTMAFGTKY